MGQPLPATREMTWSPILKKRSDSASLRALRICENLTTRKRDETFLAPATKNPLATLVQRTAIALTRCLVANLRKSSVARCMLREVHVCLKLGGIDFGDAKRVLLRAAAGEAGRELGYSPECANAVQEDSSELGLPSEMP